MDAYDVPAPTLSIGRPPSRCLALNSSLGVTS